MTGVQTCALPICSHEHAGRRRSSQTATLVGPTGGTAKWAGLGDGEQSQEPEEEGKRGRQRPLEPRERRGRVGEAVGRRGEPPSQGAIPSGRPRRRRPRRTAEPTPHEQEVEPWDPGSWRSPEQHHTGSDRGSRGRSQNAGDGTAIPAGLLAISLLGESAPLTSCSVQDRKSVV